MANSKAKRNRVSYKANVQFRQSIVRDGRIEIESDDLTISIPTKLPDGTMAFVSWGGMDTYGVATKGEASDRGNYSLGADRVTYYAPSGKITAQVVVFLEPA